MKAAPRMGMLVSFEQILPDRIMSSTAKRARNTANAVAEAAEFEGEIELDARLYMATPRDILSRIRKTDDSVITLMIVGHNPGLEDLVSLLLHQAVRFPTAALACLDFKSDHWNQLVLGTSPESARIWRPRDLDRPEAVS